MTDVGSDCRFQREHRPAHSNRSKVATTWTEKKDLLPAACNKVFELLNNNSIMHYPWQLLHVIIIHNGSLPRNTSDLCYCVMLSFCQAVYDVARYSSKCVCVFVCVCVRACWWEVRAQMRLIDGKHGQNNTDNMSQFPMPKSHLHLNTGRLETSLY